MTDDSTTQPYRDDELVYVDPDNRTIIGPVEWSRIGNPKSLQVPEKETEMEKGKRRRSERKYYPWGTFRSMKHAFLEGKKKGVGGMNFDDALTKVLRFPSE